MKGHNAKLIGQNLLFSVNLAKSKYSFHIMVNLVQIDHSQYPAASYTLTLMIERKSLR